MRHSSIRFSVIVLALAAVLLTAGQIGSATSSGCMLTFKGKRVRARDGEPVAVPPKSSMPDVAPAIVDRVMGACADFLSRLKEGRVKGLPAMEVRFELPLSRVQTGPGKD